MDAVTLLKREDAKLLKILRKLEDTTAGDPAERELLVNQARIQIRAGQQAEEDILLPELRFHGKPEAAERTAQEGREILGTLNELRNQPPDRSEYQYIIERLHGQVLQHVQWKEHEVLPWLGRIITPEETETLGERLERTMFDLRRRMAREV
jgi:hypothetical protein